jgi:hypothetical protein
MTTVSVSVGGWLLVTMDRGRSMTPTGYGSHVGVSSVSRYDENPPGGKLPGEPALVRNRELDPSVEQTGISD